jgi:hypothetical protein
MLSVEDVSGVENKQSHGKWCGDVIDVAIKEKDGKKWLTGRLGGW